MQCRVPLGQKIQCKAETGTEKGYMSIEKYREHYKNLGKIVKKIYVPNKIVNIVINKK